MISVDFEEQQQQQQQQQLAGHDQQETTRGRGERNRVLETCDHRHVTRYYRSFVTPNLEQIWIVMEYCGGSVRGVLNRERARERRRCVCDCVKWTQLFTPERKDTQRYQVREYLAHEIRK